jgi:hypothetical protein
LGRDRLYISCNRRDRLLTAAHSRVILPRPSCPPQPLTGFGTAAVECTSSCHSGLLLESGEKKHSSNGHARQRADPCRVYMPVAWAAACMDVAGELALCFRFCCSLHAWGHQRHQRFNGHSFFYFAAFPLHTPLCQLSAHACGHACMADSGPWGRVKSHADMHDKTLIYYEHAVSHVRTSLLILKRAIVWSDTQSACKRHVSMCSAPFHLRRSVDRAVRSTATLRTAHACMLNNCTTSLRPPL